MSRQKMDSKKQGQLKKMRRARGGRTLPRSGGGIHKDKKSKQLERQVAKEMDEEIENWEQNVADELMDELEDNADITDDEFWDEWCYPDYDEGEQEHFEEIFKDLRSKEKKDVSTG